MFPDYWAIPWWNHENDETAEETTIREVKEEVWLDFIPNHLFLEEINENYHFHRYIWEHSWEIKIQVEECDWYWWFNLEESLALKINENMVNIFNKLKEEGYL